MNMRSNSYKVWLDEQSACKAWCKLVDAGMPPVVRVVPRDPIEARLLRAAGTPAELIGPEPQPSDEMSDPGFWDEMGRRARPSRVASRS